MDPVKGQWAFTDTCQQMDDSQRRSPGMSALLVEDAGNRPAVIKTLRQKIPGVVLVKPLGGQLVRAPAAG